MTKSYTISIIGPVYNEEGNIEEFFKRLSKTLTPYKYEVIFVNDGSSDDSSLILSKLADENSNVKVINFSRNFGHQVAVTAGLDYAKGDAVIITDTDLQDPPEIIPELIKQWQAGFEVVNAKRRTRKDGLFKRITAFWFYKILNMFLSHKIPEAVGDFRLLDAKPVRVLRKIREKDRYIRGLTNWIGFKQTFVEFDRDERYSGSTHYPIRKMISLAANALYSFSGFPLKLAYAAFAVFFTLSFVIFIYAVAIKLAGEIVPGWTSQVLITVVFGSIQMFVLAIISEYVGRIYQQGQARPLYIVSDTININDEPES